MVKIKKTSYVKNLALAVLGFGIPAISFAQNSEAEKNISFFGDSLLESDYKAIVDVYNGFKDEKHTLEKDYQNKYIGILNKRVIYLDISQSKIDSISPAIGNLSRLKQLNLSYNKLKKLPKEIAKLENLEFLNIRGNQLESDSVYSQIKNALVLK